MFALAGIVRLTNTNLRVLVEVKLHHWTLLQIICDILFLSTADFFFSSDYLNLLSRILACLHTELNFVQPFCVSQVTISLCWALWCFSFRNNRSVCNINSYSGSILHALMSCRAFGCVSSVRELNADVQARAVEQAFRYGDASSRVHHVASCVKMF